MAAIRERKTSSGKVRFHVQVRLKGYPVQTASFERKTDARKWAADVESNIRAGRHFKNAEAKRHTLAELIDRYIAEVLTHKKAKTQKPQHNQLAHWKDELGAYLLSDITPARLAEARDKLARLPLPPQKASYDSGTSEDKPRFRSPATINRYLAALSHAFTVAVTDWGWVEDNPLRRVTKRREDNRRTRFLSDDERARLLEACKASSKEDLYLAVVLSLATGARQQEIMGLRWAQVDFSRRAAVLMETKNGDARVLPLAAHVLELLKARAKVRRIDTDLVFPGRIPSRPVDLRKPWLIALKSAGIEDFRWHDLRHSAASYLAMSGASLAEIAEVLGHKTLAMVKRYSHFTHAHSASVVERMNSKIFGG